MENQEDIKKFSDDVITLTLPQPVYKMMMAHLFYMCDWMSDTYHPEAKFESVDYVLDQFERRKRKDGMFQLKTDYRDDHKQYRNDFELMLEPIMDAYSEVKHQYIDGFKEQVNRIYRELEDPDVLDLVEGEMVEIGFAETVTCTEGFNSYD